MMLHNAYLNGLKLVIGYSNFTICANCKQIRDDKGYWTQVEAYIQERSQARFTHGICPACMKKLYPNVKQKN
jgi:hypothetical protein